MLNLQTIRESFDRIAGRYDRYAALENEVCTRLMERSDFQRRAPGVILDLGCGTGSGAARLKKKYRQAQVIGLDASPLMLSRLRSRSKMLRPLRAVCGDMEALPFPAASADMVFSNLACFWCADPGALFAEIRRVLRPDGMLLFSSYGPDSLLELRESLEKLGRQIQAPHFSDLLELGDVLVAAGFREPVMDVDRISLHYRSLAAMKEELESTGTSLLVHGWEKLKSSGGEWEAAYAPLMTGDKYPLGFEVIFGTAFGPPEGQPRKTSEGDVATFSVESLLNSRRQKG